MLNAEWEFTMKQSGWSSLIMIKRTNGTQVLTLGDSEQIRRCDEMYRVGQQLESRLT